MEGDKANALSLASSIRTLSSPQLTPNCTAGWDWADPPLRHPEATAASYRLKTPVGNGSGKTKDTIGDDEDRAAADRAESSPSDRSSP